jgi:hypothetical protein
VRSLTVPILTSGALIEVHLGFSDARRRVMRRQGRQVPPPAKATLLIDTGASMSLVDEALMRALQITPTSVTSFTRARPVALRSNATSMT